MSSYSGLKEPRAIFKKVSKPKCKLTIQHSLPGDYVAIKMFYLVFINEIGRIDQVDGIDISCLYTSFT